MQNNKTTILDYFKELEFIASEHKYQLGGRVLNSVSSVIKKYTAPFDAYKIAGFVAAKRGISKEEVLAEWEAKKNAACDRGNEAHEFAENLTTSMDIYDSEFGLSHSVPTSNGLQQAILKFWDNIPDYIEPALFELKMFSEELGIAGTADLILYNNKTGKFIICDYKTNEDLFKNYKKKKLLKPFNDLLDMPYSKYELQLSMYQILFEQCGYEVESRKIIWLQDDGTYKSYKTQDLTTRLLNELTT